LIQTSVGAAAGVGRPAGNRSGWVAYAVASTAARSATRCWAKPKCTSWGREQPETAMVMFGIVSGEEDVPVGPRVLDRAEPAQERQPVLEGLELRLRERVVVGHVGARMRLAHAQIGQQEG